MNFSNKNCMHSFAGQNRSFDLWVENNLFHVFDLFLNLMLSFFVRCSKSLFQLWNRDMNLQRKKPSRSQGLRTSEEIAPEETSWNMAKYVQNIPWLSKFYMYHFSMYFPCLLHLIVQFGRSPWDLKMSKTLPANWGMNTWSLWCISNVHLMFM